MIGARGVIDRPPGFHESYAGVLSPVELGAEIRAARFKLEVLRVAPPGRIDLLA